MKKKILMTRRYPEIGAKMLIAVGFDNIDVKEANRLGIPVGYTPEMIKPKT